MRPCELRAAGQEMSRIVQERNRVETNLKELKKQLAEYQVKLSKTKKDEASSLKALNNIRSQILVFERLIGENQAYLNSLDRQIESLSQELDVNRENYGRVSSDFSRLAVAAYKHGGDRNAETLLSSGSMNDAVVRARYMGFLSQSVKYKVNDLQSSAERIQTAQAELQESYRLKEAALKAQQVQLKEFASKKREKETVLSTIKQDRSTYIARITEVRRKQRELQSKIESLIMAEQAIIQREQERARQLALQRQRARQARIAEARRLAAERQRQQATASRSQLQNKLAELRKNQARPGVARPTEPGGTTPRTKVPEAVVPPSKPPETGAARLPETVPAEERATLREEPMPAVVDPEEVALERVSVDFDRAAGRLPWPVGNGVVVRHFGTSRDKDLNIVTSSNGIDISVPVNSAVRTVSGGKVAQIAYLPTFGNVVIIRHPKSYLTVYANLTRVSVAKGDVIRSGQTLGASGAMPEGGSLVHFEIWKGKVKQNPEKWLR